MNDLNITTIPVFETIDNDGNIKFKKVAAYVRVSTIKDLQYSSFKLQTTTYFNKIMNNPKWEYAGIFSDHGKSGTNIIKRAGFNKMIELAKMGEIDLILTKSISRFSRDVVDSLETIQELRNIDVEVYFENENISSTDPSFDMMLTILSSLSEEESKSISNNVLWTYKTKMKNGDSTTPRLYGYTIKDGNFIINEDEAKVVRLIFNLFLEGYKINQIINEIHELGIKTRTGNDKFSPTVIRETLRNEKYVGDMRLQKSTVKDIGMRASTVNRTKPMYYVHDNHDAIVDRDTFDKVQNIIKERRVKFGPNDDEVKIEHLYANFVYSLKANKFYRTKINHRNTPYEVKLLELLDKSEDRILNVKNVYYRQLDYLFEDLFKQINSDINFKYKVDKHFKDTLEKSSINSDIKLLESNIYLLRQKEKAITSSSLLDDAKEEMMAQINNDLIELNIELTNLKHYQIMSYNYDSGLKIFLKQLKQLDEYDVKDIFNLVIVEDRENLNVVLKLSNISDDDIDYYSLLKSKEFYNGVFQFSQTRLHLNVNWRFFII